MAAAVPFALKAGTMIGGSLLGKKLSGPSGGQKQAMEASQQGTQNLNAISRPLLGGGLSMAAEGGRDLGAAGSYYRNILSSRQAGRESLAPEMTSAMEFYRGAENKAKRTLQGGQRDQAVAELDRQKVAQMAGMLPGARRDAAEGMAGLGGQRIAGGTALTGQGVNAASTAGYLGSGLFNQATTVRDQEQEGGSVWGKFLGDIMGEMPWGKKRPMIPGVPQGIPEPIYAPPRR